MSAGRTGDGVIGAAGTTGGNGVHGIAESSSGAGVLAENTGGGTALKATGPAVFSRSGILTVAAGKSSGTVTGVPLTAASLVLATLQQHLTGGVRAGRGAECRRQLVHRVPEQGAIGQRQRGLVRSQLRLSPPP